MELTIDFLEKKGSEIPRTDNIFEIPNHKFIDRRILEFEDRNITKYGILYYVFENFVDDLCFYDWKIFTDKLSAIAFYEKIYRDTGGIGECS